ncbi:MAG TPA: hypothetical protein VFH68_01555 [Polyangia bacterium]|jgi:hypothetical protein|nr:hypothetical protein [Polyangia bacterium]
MAMDCGEFKELAGAWALGALDESECAACAAHLARPEPHQGCQDCHRDARALTERLAGAVPEHPVNTRVWNAIADRVRAEKRASVASKPVPPPEEPRPPRHLASV